MNLKKQLSDYSRDPFLFVDSINLSRGRFTLNIFQNFHQLRKVAIGTAVFTAAMWVICGFDSTPLQFLHVLYEGVPGLVLGRLNLGDLIGIYHLYYGKEMHYSAFVIYFGQYAFLSKYFEKRLGWTKSRNVIYSAGIVFLSIATFEFFWIYNYAFWQNQPWTMMWAWPQLRILMQNLVFIVAGALTLFYMFIDSFILDANKQISGRLYSFHINLKAIMLIALTLSLAVLWIYYPFHVDRITVSLASGGSWTNSDNFPQTLYTIDTNTSDAVNAGEWFYVANDAVHALNTSLKFVWTLSITYLGAVVKRKQDE